jgi:acetyl esterase/lipase
MIALELAKKLNAAPFGRCYEISRESIMRTIATAVLLACLALPITPASAFPAAPTYADVEVAHITYQGQPFDLKMNVYLPPGPKGQPTPIVLSIHGKGGTYNQPKTYALNLVDHGVAVATIDFRKAGMPGMLYDTKAYIRFVRAHAAEFNIDPKRVGIWGGSRGGELAALLAVTGDNKKLEGDVGGNLDQSSMLQASVIYYPLTDIFLNTDGKVVEMLPDYVGTNEADSEKVLQAYKKHDTASPYWKYVQQVEAMNPMNYITKNSPPALIAVAGDDMGNPIINSLAMYEKYLEQGAPAHFYTYTLGTHGNVGKNIDEATVEWQVEHLAKNVPPQFPAPLRKQPPPSACKTSGFCTLDPIIANR